MIGESTFVILVLKIVELRKGGSCIIDWTLAMFWVLACEGLVKFILCESLWRVTKIDYC